MSLSFYTYSDPQHAIFNPHKQQQSFDSLRPESSVLSLIDIIQTKGMAINCCFDRKRHVKVLSCSGENLYSFNSFISLLARNPEIDDATILAKALNYLIDDEGGQVITDPQKFKKEYADLYSYDPTKMPDFNGEFFFHLSQQEHYDTSVIEPPRIIDTKLVFYIEIRHTPHKVTCEWPVVTDPPSYKRETLPLLQEELFN